jgi:hypothetical protein
MRRTFVFFLETNIGFATHFVWITSLIKPAFNSLEISFAMAQHFSSLKRLIACLTGFELGIICRACSASSLGTPVMSDGCHAKISRFSWRNSTSALSYLEDKFVPIEVVLAASRATSSTYFVSTVGLKVGGEADTSGLDAGISAGSVAAWISLNSSPKNTASARAASPSSHSLAFRKCHKL